MKCPKCRNENAPGATRCETCGMSLPSDPEGANKEKRPLTSGEKTMVTIAIMVGIIIIGVLAQSTTISAIGALLLSLYLAVKVVPTKKTGQEIVAETIKEEQKEKKKISKIERIQEKIARLEQQAGMDKKLWIAHFDLIYEYNLLFINTNTCNYQLWDGDFDYLIKTKEQWEWAKEHAPNEKKRHHCENEIKRIDDDVKKWRTTALEWIKNPDHLKKAREMCPGFDPGDYMKRLDEAFPPV